MIDKQAQYAQAPDFLAASFGERYHLATDLGSDASGIGGIGDVGPAGIWNDGFSSSFILRLAAVRLKQVDSTLERVMGDMESCSATSEVLNAFKSELSRCPEFKGGGEGQDFAILESHCKELASRLPEGDPIRQQLEDMVASMNKDGDNWFGRDETNGARTKIDELLKSVDSKSQMASLVVNQKIGERSEVMTLASQLMTAINEMAKSLAGNIGR